jgi:hypothetical protein
MYQSLKVAKVLMYILYTLSLILFLLRSRLLPQFFFQVVRIKAIETGMILLIMDIKYTFMYFFKDL